MTENTKKLNELHDQQYKTAVDIIFLLPYKYRLSVVEDLSSIELCEYNNELVEKEKLAELYHKLASEPNVLLKLLNFGKAYAILELQYRKYEAYVNRFVTFLKEHRLYSSNVKCKYRDGAFIYKDKDGLEHKFV